MKAAFAITLLLLACASASAQTVVPSACPEGYVHEGADCVLREGGEVIQYPFSYFRPGGRFFHHGGFIRPRAGAVGRSRMMRKR